MSVIVIVFVCLFVLSFFFFLFFFFGWRNLFFSGVSAWFEEEIEFYKWVFIWILGKKIGVGVME